MFRSQSSVSYRMGKSRMGKKLKNHTRLLFLAAVALVAIVLTVIWGIVWGEQAQQSATEREKLRKEAQLEAESIPEWLPAPPVAIRAAYLGRITTLDAAVSAAQTLLEEGNTALSVPLYDDGTPRYDSAVAQALGRQLSGENDVTLSRLFAAILAQDGYISVTFPCTWQTETDTAMRNILAAYEAALIAEIAQSGAQEILLLDLDLSAEQLDTTAAFLRDVRAAAPDAVIGVAVPTATVLGDDHTATLRTVLTWADFTAVDLRDSHTVTAHSEKEDGTLTHDIADTGTILSLLDPALTRYRMRLLLPTSMYEKLEIIEAMGYANWQIIR